MAKKISAYKAHEARMWAQNIIGPAVGIVACWTAIPENRQKAKELLEGAKMKIQESKLYQKVFQK